MFISREDALAKLNHKDNPFSPARRGSTNWGRVVEVVDVVSVDNPVSGDADPTSTVPSSAPVSEDSPVSDASTVEETASPSAQEIRNILKQVDPAVARNRSILPSHSLRGNIPVQAAIGETALLIGSRTAGALYDRSIPQTVAYEHGHGMSRSLYGAEKGPPKPELTERLGAFKEKLALAAGRVLESALDKLDEEKLKKVKLATNISRVAKDMAVIMDKVSGPENQDNAVHFHIYRPDMRSVNAYETVKVNGGVAEAPALMPASSDSSGGER